METNHRLNASIALAVVSLRRRMPMGRNPRPAVRADFAAVAQTDRTDEFVKSEMERQRIPGLSLVVLQHGKIVKAAGYGLAERHRKIPATAETVYKIGSVSKQFIATGVMLLVQEGRVRLDDPISKYLAGTPASWGPITLRHLLTHTSGILREAPGFDPFKVQPDADVIRTAYSVPLRFAPGGKYAVPRTPGISRSPR